jgi:hypothetical protein
MSILFDNYSYNTCKSGFVNGVLLLCKVVSSSARTFPSTISIIYTVVVGVIVVVDTGVIDDRLAILRVYLVPFARGHLVVRREYLADIRI